jgi:hypothetical protein
MKVETLSRMKAAFKSLLISLAVAFADLIGEAASVKPSALPTTATLSTNSGFLVDSISGSTHTTRTTSYSNLLAQSQVRSGTNFSNRGWMTNILGGLALGCREDNVTDRRLAFLDSTNGAELGGLLQWHNAGHSGELNLYCNNTISITAGYDGLANSYYQIGSSGGYHDIPMFQYDSTSGDPRNDGSNLGNSKFVVWCSRYYNGTAVKDHHMGFRNESLDQAGNAELAFYGFAKGFSQVVDDPGNIRVGGFGTNNLHFLSGIFTNWIRLGGDYASIAGDGPNSTVPTLDIVSGGISQPGIILGGDLGSATRTNGGAKFATVGFTASDLSLKSLLFVETTGGNEVSGNVAMFGGGTGSLGYMDGHEFYAGSVGSVRMAISSTDVHINNALKVGASGTDIGAVYSASATIDIPSTAAQTSFDTNIVVTGAAVAIRFLLPLPAQWISTVASLVMSLETTL